jgi:hypothetical protein
MKSEQHPGVPGHREGGQTDSVEKVTSPSLGEARQLFQEARRRLRDINNWHKLCGIASAVFRLTDEHGKEIEGEARQGNLVKIDIPGPGSAAGEGFDWVHIEAMEDLADPKGERESFMLRVRPTSNPLNKEKGTAHFYTSDATSTYVIERNGSTVTAAEHGRNEKPNAKADLAADKIRNTIVGIGGISGISKIQWKSLVKGLLER